MEYMTLFAAPFRFNCPLVLNEKNNALGSSEKLTELEQCYGLKEFSENVVNANPKTPI